MNDKKVISIHQPNYLPWLGYFYKIYKSNTFVSLDDTQFSNTAMHEFNYIKNKTGKLKIRVPVQYKFGDALRDVKIKNTTDWKANHLKMLQDNYSQAKYFTEIFRDFSEILNDSTETLISELNLKLIIHICNKFGFKNIEYIKSSALNLQTKREEKILDLCNTLQADVYYSGVGAKAYQTEESFTNRGLILEYSDFKAFEYPQLFGEYEGYLSVIDYLMNFGYDWDFVMSHQR